MFLNERLLVNCPGYHNCTKSPSTSVFKRYLLKHSLFYKIFSSNLLVINSNLYSNVASDAIVVSMRFYRREKFVEGFVCEREKDNGGNRCALYRKEQQEKQQ